jgi:hypothetical protein
MELQTHWPASVCKRLDAISEAHGKETSLVRWRGWLWMRPDECVDAISRVDALKARTRTFAISH